MIRKGSEVTWKWGNGDADGNKALYIEQNDGDKVLKLESEVTKKN